MEGRDNLICMDFSRLQTPLFNFLPADAFPYGFFPYAPSLHRFLKGGDSFFFRLIRFAHTFPFSAKIWISQYKSK